MPSRIDCPRNDCHRMADLRADCVMTVLMTVNCITAANATHRPRQVVMTNQVTTKPGADAAAALAPALGESWAHACTNRVMLHWQNQSRCARLLKSPSNKPTTVQFVVESGAFVSVSSANRLSDGCADRCDVI
jgi:hypothetical protein